MAELLLPTDRSAVEQLAHSLIASVRRHYIGRPMNRSTVYEVLNALGAVTGVVLAGTGADSDEARAWFEQALEQNLSGNLLESRGGADA